MDWTSLYQQTAEEYDCFLQQTRKGSSSSTYARIYALNKGDDSSNKNETIGAERKISAPIREAPASLSSICVLDLTLYQHLKGSSNATHQYNTEKPSLGSLTRLEPRRPAPCNPFQKKTRDPAVQLPDTSHLQAALLPPPPTLLALPGTILLTRTWPLAGAPPLGVPVEPVSIMLRLTGTGPEAFMTAAVLGDSTLRTASASPAMAGFTMRRACEAEKIPTCSGGGESLDEAVGDRRR
jgi:hypothetical protein